MMTTTARPPRRESKYAAIWADSINQTYTADAEDLALDACQDGEEIDAAIRRVLKKAADALRGYTPTVTFTGRELDLVRHLMPAHEVHQSGSVRWVLENYGNVESES